MRRRWRCWDFVHATSGTDRLGLAAPQLYFSVVPDAAPGIQAGLPPKSHFMIELFRDVDGGPLCPDGSVVCIGAFDGLHLGHRALVRHAVARARVLGLPAVALSFEPLPREFFAPAAPPPRLDLPRAKFEGL